MVEGAAHFFLFFSHFEVIIAVILMGIIFGPRSCFLSIIYLALLDLVINVALKGTFKIPLAPWLHPGYAFPSGHMQLVTVFYGSLAVLFSAVWFRLTMISIMLGEGWALIYCRYHDFNDVVAAGVVGVLLIMGNQYLWNYFKQKTPWILMLTAIFCMIYNRFIYTVVPLHATIAFVGLIFLLSIERFLFYKSRCSMEL